MLEAQCEGTEIAGALGINEETLYRRCESDNSMGFSEYKQIKREAGKSILRAEQFNKAKDGNTTMLVWLGKQYLGQKDKVETEDKSLSLFDKWISQYETDAEADTGITAAKDED